MTRSKLIKILEAAACVLLAVMLSAAAIGIYRDGAARRSEDPRAAIYTPEIVAARLAPMAPLAIVAAGLLAAGLALGGRDARADGGVRAAGAGTKECPAVRARHPRAIRLIVLAAAIVFILLGVFNGSARDVLYKAITICTECVGLG